MTLVALTACPARPPERRDGVQVAALAALAALSAERGDIGGLDPLWGLKP